MKAIFQKLICTIHLSVENKVDDYLHHRKACRSQYHWARLKWAGVGVRLMV